MSMKIVRLGSFLFAFVLAASAFCVEFTVLAGNSTSQNTNSSTTAAENSNTGKTTSGRRHRQKRAAAATPAETSTASAAESTSTAATEQTDLSGTYTGTFDCSDAGVSGETTLTITGNQFTLTDGKSGRIVASTTSGYTGVAMQFGELATIPTAQPGTPPIIVSMRAKKSGDRLTLTTVPGASHVCSFTPSGASRGARSRNRKARPAAPATAATPTEPATPAEPTMATPPASAGPEPPATPAPRRRGRRGSRSNTNTNSNMNMNNNTGTATPTPRPAIPRN
jgi:hypothetical protein